MLVEYRDRANGVLAMVKSGFSTIERVLHEESSRVRQWAAEEQSKRKNINPTNRCMATDCGLL
jgi:hypothetical protein